MVAKRNAKGQFVKGGGTKRKRKGTKKTGRKKAAKGGKSSTVRSKLLKEMRDMGASGAGMKNTEIRGYLLSHRTAPSPLTQQFALPGQSAEKHAYLMQVAKAYGIGTTNSGGAGHLRVDRNDAQLIQALTSPYGVNKQCASFKKRYNLGARSVNCKRVANARYGLYNGDLDAALYTMYQKKRGGMQPSYLAKVANYPAEFAVHPYPPYANSEGISTVLRPFPPKVVAPAAVQVQAPVQVAV